MKRIFFSLTFAAALLSCAKEQQADLQPTPTPAGSERICASASDFVCGDYFTKTVITQEGSDAPKFAWKEGDVIGVIPMNNKTVQSNYEIAEISSDPKEAMFDGGVWALKEGKEYAAYYPYQYEAIPSSGSLTFSFLGQTQTANNSLAHLGAYDYMYASSVVPSAGAATFQFNHLVSLVRLQLTVPATDTYKAVRLESDNAWFASGASLKLSDGTMTGSDLLMSYTLNLSDIDVSEGKVLTIWVALLPTTGIKDKTLAVKLYGATTYATASVSIADEFKAGSAYSYSCTPAIQDGPEYVDLGLSVKWATCNLGARSPEEYGDYYAWGETETKSKYSTHTYKFYKSEIVSEGGFDVEYSGYTKYIPQSKADSYGFRGFYDNKSVLDAEDDVAHVKLGGKWRMPTYAEIDELISNCQCDWITYEGVKGRKFTSKKSGYTDKWIFLPAAGYQSGGGLVFVGSYGGYWSSFLSTDAPSYAYSVIFSSGTVGRSYRDRYNGLSVRPVLE